MRQFILHMEGGEEVIVTAEELKLVEERIRDERRIMVTLKNGIRVVAQKVNYVVPIKGSGDETVEFINELSGVPDDGQPVNGEGEAAKEVDRRFELLKAFKRSELSHADFAEKIGISENMLRRFINDTAVSKVTEEMITKLRDAFSPPQAVIEEA